MCCFPWRTQRPVRKRSESRGEAGEGCRAGGESRKQAGGERWDSPHTETLKARLTELRSNGFNRLYQQGRIFEFSTPESLLDLDFTLPVFVLLDRIVVSAENRARIVDAAEIAYREGGEVTFEEVPRDETAERKAPSVLQAHTSARAAIVRQGTGAAPLQLQQPLRGVSQMSRIRQHGGLRLEPGESRIRD